MKQLTLILAFLAIVAVVWAGNGVERYIPSGTCGSCQVVEVTASETTIIYPYWNRTRVVIEQGFNVSEEFRVAIATSTIDTDLPTRTSFSQSFKGSCFITLQTATDTANLVVSQFQE